MPAKNRIGRDDGGDFLQGLSSQRSALDRQTAALVVAERNAFAAVSFLERVNLGQKEVNLRRSSIGPDGHLSVGFIGNWRQDLRFGRFF
jgi:hypothetical protein